MTEPQIGHCEVTENYDEEKGTRSIRIDRADPVVKVAASVMRQAEAGRLTSVTFEDQVLTLAGTNRTVRYAIGEFDTESEMYLGRLLES